MYSPQRLDALIGKRRTLLEGEGQPRSAGTEAAVEARKDWFRELLDRAVAGEKAADSAIHEYASGRSYNLHETMITLQKADINFNLLMSVRGKLLEAYREVMRLG
jgi:flagellar hook-basal body complex protein FliE